MKHTILLLFALLSAATLSAQEAAQTDTEPQDTLSLPAQRFGYLSYNEMLQAMPEYRTVVDQLIELGNTYDTEMERAEEEFTRKFQEFVEGQRTFPDNIMLKRQKELQQLMDQTLQFKEEAKQQLTEEEEALMQPLHQKLRDVMREVGLEHNYPYILNTDNNSYPFLNTTSVAEDCSEYVLEKLRR